MNINAEIKHNKYINQDYKGLIITGLFTILVTTSVLVINYTSIVHNYMMLIILIVPFAFIISGVISEYKINSIKKRGERVYGTVLSVKETSGSKK